MMGKPMKTLDLHYLLIQFLIMWFTTQVFDPASWLARSSPDRAIRIRAQAGGIALYSWARYFTLTAHLSNQVYKWVQAILTLGVTLRWTYIPSMGE